MGGWDPRAWGAHREGGMLPILPTNAHPSSLSCPQGGLGDGDSQDLSGNEAGDPQNLWSNRPGGDQAGWERGTVRGHGGGDERGMISAPLPSPGPPRSFAPPDLQIPGKDLSRWIPAKGGRSSSTIREVPAAPSLPRAGKGTGDLGRIKKAKRNLSGLEGASHIPGQAGKGKCRQGQHGGGDGSSQDTRGEGEENSNREQRGQAGVWGRLISASSSKKK